MKPIFLLSETYDAREARFSAPFVNSAGIELLNLLAEAEIITLTATDQDYLRKFWQTSDPAMIDMVWRLHPEVHRHTVFPFYPPNAELENICGPKATAIPGYPSLFKGASGYVQSIHQPHLDALATALNHVDPNIVVAFGNTPLWALCGTTGVAKLRGTTRISTHTVADFKILSAYHPAAVQRQHELQAITGFDLMKAKRENESPLLMYPERHIWIEPSYDDFLQFYTEHIRGTDLLSVDIETAGDQITCIGFAPTSRIAIVIPFVDARKANRSYWASALLERKVWDLVRTILADRTIPKLFQNGLYDIAFLRRSMKIKVYGAEHDTMLLHHALQPESLKALDFLGSIYTNEGAWKRDHRVHTVKRDS